MADPKLLKLLQQGSETWNRWRKQQPEALRVDLSNADLRSVKLRGANLRNAELYGANLDGADLSGADLSGANLLGSNLSSAVLISVTAQNANFTLSRLYQSRFEYADLRGAKFEEVHAYRPRLYDTKLNKASFFHASLIGASFDRADLSEASFEKANCAEGDFIGTNLSRSLLTDANFQRANLKNADFSHATIGWTQFGDRDFRTIAHLETVQHKGPSPISINSLYRSNGAIPETFLRQAGIPDDFLAYYYSLTHVPINYYTCFIAYSHNNKDFARRLYADLQREGVRCWFAEEDLKIGDHYHQRIDEAIRLYDKLILVLSDEAVRSAWVEREVVSACEKEDRQQREVLFPLRLDDAVMQTGQAWAADVRRRWHIGDFTSWKDHDQYQIAFELLLHDLKRAEE